MINVELLATICRLPGAPGYEKKIRNFVIEKARPLVDKIDVDPMGNVICLKRGKGSKKAMVAAHMDEIGFIVTHIDEEGFVRFHTLGGFDPKTLTSQRVIIHGKKDLIGVMGIKPIHLMSQEERGKPSKTTDFFIDLGMSKEEVLKFVEIGDPITRERELIEMGDCVNSKSIDNRVSVFVLLEALRKLVNKEIPHDLYAVFTVQEEVGLRGAIKSAHLINPDFGIGLDTTIAYDVPGSQAHENITKLGGGAGIKIMDGTSICDYRMVAYMKDVAQKSKIKWQAELLPFGGTDTAGLQRSGKNGAIAGAISIPTRHLHQTIEMAHKRDINDCIELLVECLIGWDDFDWSF